MRFLRFVGFSVIRAWQGFWRNAMMSIATTATVVLMLVLLSGLMIVLGGLDSGLRFIESKVAVTARLIDDLPAAQIDALVAETRAQPGVESVGYVSPEAALERLREFYADLGLELNFGGASITLYGSVEVGLVSPSDSGSVAAFLAARPEVLRITTRQQDYEKLSGIIGTIRIAGLAAIGLVGLTVLFMIVNTIRIAVYARAGEIEIMRLVGASDAFIRWPFILEGILCGLIGAAVTLLLVAIIWEPIQPVMVGVFQMPTAVTVDFLTTLSGVVLGVGLGVGALGSWISVRSNLGASS